MLTTMEHYEKRLAELQIQVQDIQYRLNADGPSEDDTAKALAPDTDLYRRECESLKQRMKEYAEKAEMWAAKYHEAAEALERAHDEVSELRQSLSRVHETAAKEAERGNQRAVFGVVR